MSDIVDLSPPSTHDGDDPGENTARDAPSPGGARPSLLPGVLEVVAGLAATWVGLLSLRGGNGWVQTLVTVVGLSVLYVGARSLLRRRFGASFDLATWLALVWVVLLVAAAVLAPVLPLGEYRDIASTLSEKPLQHPDILSAHPLGTNNFGLDLLARVLYGARSSLVVAFGAVLIGLVLGAALGILAGFFRKKVDAVIGVLTNSLLAVPPLILLIALGTVLEPSLRNIALGLSLLALPSMVRMARASTLSFAGREFVLAARSMGASPWRLMSRELLPNVLLPLASYAMVMVSVLIVAEASLSFLGLGIRPPDPSWGNMIAEGQGRVFKDNPFIVLVPGTALFLTVFSLNLLGERARTRFDPRQAKI
jgi:peptide/nickel transport system permease protein